MPSACKTGRSALPLQATVTREVSSWSMITNLRMAPYERGLEEGGEAMEFFSDFEKFPSQTGSSLNAGGINYGLLRQQDAMKHLKEMETMSRPGN